MCLIVINVGSWHDKIRLNMNRFEVALSLLQILHCHCQFNCVKVINIITERMIKRNIKDNALVLHTGCSVNLLS